MKNEQRSSSDKFSSESSDLELKRQIEPVLSSQHSSPKLDLDSDDDNGHDLLGEIDDISDISCYSSQRS